MTDLTTLRFFATPPHSCSYLDDQDASTIFVDPNQRIDANLYEQLSKHGFRRSGPHVYRPHCAQCSACIAARVPVNDFKPSRRHKRCIKANSDIIVEEIPSIDTAGHFALYERYINERHCDGDMYPASKEQFDSFLSSEWGVTRYFEMKLDGLVVGVMVSDKLPNGLSAMYTFFDPDLSKRSLGTFAILWQVGYAQREKMDYLYLGYWIKESDKMNYKSQYRPLELLIENKWLLLK
ncbi:arginyltransferase [Aurantivibrio plasticivorans]